MNVSYFVFPAVALYLAAGLGIGLRLFSHPQPTRIPRPLTLALGFGAALLHAIVLYLELHTAAGINLDFFNAAALTAWMIVVLLLVSALSKPVDNLAIIIFPMAAILLLLDLRYPGQHLLDERANWALRLHVITSILAYAMLTLASVQALLLAVQDNHLRSHHPGGFVRALPPLQTMEALLFELIGVGFILLSVSLLSGFAYLEDMFAQHVAHKTILSILAWIAFGVLLWGRMRFGWRGRTAIRWTLLGFAALMIAYFGSKAILELVLNR
jgi:ABC-type uncharacterized transport system permease subunit